MLILDPEKIKYIEVLIRLDGYQGTVEAHTCCLGSAGGCSSSLSNRWFIGSGKHDRWIQVRNPCIKHVTTYQRIQGWSELE